MNEFLNEILQEDDYKNLTKFNLLLSHGSLSDSFEHSILKLLGNVFGFNQSIFLKYSNQGVLHKYYDHNVDPESLNTYIKRYQKKDIITKLLVNHNYKINSDQAVLPNDLHESHAVKGIILKNSTLNSSYSGIYLMLNEKGDGIKILRQKNEGYFTARETQICNYLCKVLSAHYKTIEENRKFKYEVELFNKNKDNMNFGYMMLSHDFQLLSYNKLALCYSNDITDSYDIKDAIVEFKSIVNEEKNNHLQNNYNNNTVFHKSFTSFIVEIVPTILVNNNNIVETYYMVYIYNKSWFNHMQNKLNFTKEKYNLTNREKEIVSLVSKGLSNKEIADRLFISIYTVKEHMKNISKKMNVSSRTGIISKLAM